MRPACLGALLIVVSQVPHFIFAVIVPVQALDGLVWGLAAGGFAVAARTLVRSPDAA